jgi:hypothetical protein
LLTTVYLKTGIFVKKITAMSINYSHALGESYIYNCAVLKYFHRRHIDDIRRTKFSFPTPSLGKKAILKGSLNCSLNPLTYFHL